MSAACGGSAGSPGSGRARRLPRWAPSRKESRKYASLFLRTGGDAGGCVQGADAKALCARSGVGEADVALAWAHAGHEYPRGRLGFREFVVLVHLVTCRSRGLRIPSLQEGVPPELGSAVASLETPEELHRQRSRSPSSSRSLPPASRSLSPVPALPEGGRATGPQGPAAPRRLPDPLGLRPTLPHLGPEDGDLSGRSVSSNSTHSPRFGEERRGAAPGGRRPAVDVGRLASHLAALRKADRVVLQYVRESAQGMESELLQTRAASGKLQPQALREQDEGQRLVGLSKQLERQLFDARQRLTGLCEQRLSSMELRSEGGGGGGGNRAGLLREAFDEECRMLREMRHSTQELEGSCRGMSGDLESLERQRRETQGQVAQERALLQEVEARNEELRQAVQQRAREGWPR